MINIAAHKLSGYRGLFKSLDYALLCEVGHLRKDDVPWY